MSWDEGFARRYDEWTAPMTADVAFYVALARQTEGPLVELAVGNGRVAIPVGHRHRHIAGHAGASAGAGRHSGGGARRAPRGHA